MNEQEQTPQENETDSSPALHKVELPLSIRAAREALDWFSNAVWAVAFVILLLTFVVRVAQVDGSSMYKTLHGTDRVYIGATEEERKLAHVDSLFVSNLFYTPKQGDIVVFQSPDSSVGEPIIKRVIATAGQTVRIDYNTSTVTVDGKVPEKESCAYFSGGSMKAYLQGWGLDENGIFEYTVPEGYLFVMGDNRNNSKDSRSTDIGPLDERFVFGHVLIRFLPFSEFGKVN